MNKEMLQNPNWFIDQLALYQNANSSPDAVKRNFLVRIEEFEAIIAALRNKEADDPLQHELILGWRGSGKSTLLRRIQIEIDEDPELSRQFFAIYLAEEQGAIFRLSDLWFEVHSELEQQLGVKSQLTTFDQFNSDDDFVRYLFGLINQMLATAKKRIVLLLDNIDRILENLGEAGQLFREQLINYRNVQLIGASTRLTEHFWKYDQPFYDFFRVHRLKGLSFEEIHRLLNHWSESMNLPLLMDYALKNRGRVEAMRILTNGLPRALQIFIQILLHDSSLYGFDYLRKTMDHASPLYQERMNNLTAPQRKIVQEMAFHWEACATKTLVEKSRMESKTISAYLKQLQDYGIVETLPTGKKNHLYRLADRFFNMWLIITQGNPEQKRKAKYLTIFLESYYSPDELKTLATKHLADLKEGNIPFDKAVMISKGLAHSRHIGVRERDELIDLTFSLPDSEGQLGDLPERFSVLSKKAKALFDKGKYLKAIQMLDEVENEGDGVLNNLKGLCHWQNGNLKEAENYYLLAFDKGNAEASFNLAYLYQNQGKTELAEKHYPLAIEKGHTKAMNNLANLYKRQGKTEMAEKYYLLAIEKGDVNALLNLSLFLLETNKNPKKALEYIQACYEQRQDMKVLAIKTLVEVWNNRFEQVEQQTQQLLASGEMRPWFLQRLLRLNQVQLVLAQFHSEVYGKSLQEQYQLVYYAVQILAGNPADNLLLRIPPEVMPTVEKIVEEVKEKQRFYAQPPLVTE